MDTINNVSFIIITLNEEFAVKKCLDSISRIPMHNCEIICVDSGSIDKTLDVIGSFRKTLTALSVYQIKGYANAAIARNIGIKESSRDYIFFIDGDVEINHRFLSKALSLLKSEQAHAVTGKLREYQYDAGYKSILDKIDDRYKIDREKNVYSSGGLFMTTRKVIDKVGLFDERFFKHEDLDFTLRLSSGNVLKAIPEYIGIHHTIPYHNSQRLKKNFAQYHTLFGRLFIKDAFLNPQGVMMILLENWGFFGGILFYFAICISAKYYSLKLTLAVFIFIISADIFYGIFHKKNIPYRLYCHYLTPVFMLWGILKPQKNKFFTFVKVDY